MNRADTMTLSSRAPRVAVRGGLPFASGIAPRRGGSD